jgi:multidrug transporter EmrE-like cation transporter
MLRAFDHTYIFSTILFTVYSQLIMRWQVGHAGPLPADFAGRFQFIVVLLLNPWVISGVVATFFAGVSWMLVLTKFEISYAFPFVSFNFILVLLASVVLFQESLSVTKVVGTVFVIFGIVVIARG